MVSMTMKQIELEPGAYRETGRQRLVRSILHRPVFMTISTALGVWVAVAIGVLQQFNGFGRSPEWALWTLYPAFVAVPAFFLFVALADNDRAIEAAGPTSAGQQDSSAEQQAQPPAGQLPQGSRDYQSGR